MLLLAVGIGLFSIKSSRAEFEVPVVSPLLFVDAHMHGIFGYYRTSKFAFSLSPEEQGSFPLQEYFESWAVGDNLDAASAEQGIVYRYRGDEWKRVVIGNCLMDRRIACVAIADCASVGGACNNHANQPFNAIFSQYNAGSGTAPWWAVGGVGTNSKIVFTYNSSAGESVVLPEQPQFTDGQIDANPHATCVAPPVEPARTNPLLAGAAVQEFNDLAVVGGLNGLLATHACFPGARCYLNTVPGVCSNNPATACTQATEIATCGGICSGDSAIICMNNATCAAVGAGTCVATNPCSTPDIWVQSCPAGFPLANEHVTGITAAQNETFYVVTTQTPGAATLASLRTGNCNPNTGRLYRFTPEVTGPGSITLLGTQPNTCFYGITAQSGITNAAPGGPLHNQLWIAAAVGNATNSAVFLWNESPPAGWTNSGNPLPGTAIPGQRLYSISSNLVAGGVGTNLLRNGNFEAWDFPNPNTSSTIVADGWTEAAGRGRNNDTAFCGTAPDVASNTRDVRASAAGEAAEGSYALYIEPGIHYDTVADCVASANPRNGSTASVYNRVDLTNIDAAAFKVSGKYKVEFLVNPVPAAPTFAQGGFYITCPGQSGSSNPPSRRTVDCSFSTRRAMRTAAQGNTVPLTEGDIDANGYKSFSFTVSNQNTQYNTVLGVSSNPRSTSKGMIMELGCEGTYGTRVWCDDLKVEAIASTPVPAYRQVTVMAVGTNGLAVRNENATVATTAFQQEPNPAGTDSLYGVTSLGQYNFAVGANNLMVQRSPANLNGYIWAGTAGPGNSGRVALGWISSSCANTRGNDGRTLCQRSLMGYGLTYDRQPIAGVHDILSGRAWLGKSYQTSSTLNIDRESLDLGRCINAAKNPAINTTFPNEPYNISGNGPCVDSNDPGPEPDRCARNTAIACNINNQHLSCLSSCNLSTRTCVTDPTHACTRDFDCYGRCERDNGLVCLFDSDCQLGAAAAPACAATGSCTTAGSIITTLPPARIQCNDTSGNENACTSGGWLTFTPTDIIGAPPAALETAIGQRNNCLNGSAYLGPCSAGRCTQNTNITCGADADCFAGACSDLVTCPDGSRCRLKGFGQFMSLANPADPNYSAGRGWVSLRGPDALPLTTPITGACVDGPDADALPDRCSNNANVACTSANQVPCQNVAMLFGCRSCVLPAATPSDPNDQNCGFCQDQQSKSCSPAVTSCYYFCNGDPTQPACVNDASCQVGVGCVANACQGGTRPGQFCNSVTDCPAFSCRPVGRCSQNGAIACSTDQTCAAASAGYCNIGALCRPAAGNSCQTYGVNYDSQSQTFHGYAWNSDYGWLDFHTIRRGASRFIQTRLGDIYSQQRIGDITTQLPPGNSCNATYVISASGGISNFCSSLTVPGDPVNYPTVQQYAPFIPFASQTNRFANALGQFDLVGIETVTGTAPDPFNANLPTNINKYKSFVHNLAAPSTAGYLDMTTGVANDLLTYIGHQTSTNPLRGRVMIAGDATTQRLGRWFRISRDLKVYDSNFTQGAANGILIVKGNLRIDNDIVNVANSDGILVDLRNLGSLLIVVRGDLVIDTTVGNISAGFYVSGTVCTAPRGATNPPRCTTDPVAMVAGSNKFPLVVRGLMIAHEFVFARRFAGTADDPRPSELIIYDGRLQSNPMPGTADFANALPSSVRVGF